MAKYEVIFYEKINGDIPVEDFLINLDAKMRAKLVGIIGILQEYGHQLREPYSKCLGDGIFEIRGKVGSDVSRVLYFFYHDRKIILTNGFIKKTQKTPKAELEKALAWTKEKCKEGFDKNPPAVQKSAEEKEKDWEFVVKMMIIIKDLMNGNPNLPEGREEEMVGHNAIAAGFQGQRQWTDFYPNCDFPEALLNTSFDWNGAREPYVLATENDVLNGLGMMFMKLLTNRAQIFADVRTYWSPEAVKKATGYDIEGVAKDAGGFIHLINSGAACLDANGQAKDADGNGVMKPWYEVTEEDQEAILKATTWNAADFGYFRGGGYSSRFVTEAEMPVTMIRLNLVKGLGPMLQIAEGWTVKLPEEVTDVLWKRTDYTWPCTWFAPRTTGEGAFKTAYDVMNNWGANHGAISYGHIGADLITMCSMLRIPVAMHNVPEEKIFRPAAWNAFGMDKEGQDFRACQTYGPLYK